MYANKREKNYVYPHLPSMLSKYYIKNPATSQGVHCH